MLINATGSFLIGVLIVMLLELTGLHRLARPLLVVGVLGGYTTFSTFATDTEQLILDHRQLPDRVRPRRGHHFRWTTANAAVTTAYAQPHQHPAQEETGRWP